MPHDETDYEHLMECVDPHCWYCHDEPQPVPQSTRVLRQLTDEAASVLWDLGALPKSHPFKQAA